ERKLKLTDGNINIAIGCRKRTNAHTIPEPEGYRLNHSGLQIDNLKSAEARARAAGATPQPPPPVDLSKLDGRLFFEKKYVMAGVKFDLSGHGWPVAAEKK